MKLRWLFWLLIIAFVWVVVSRFAEIQTLVKTLETGQWQWVLAAALLQVLYYITYTALYQAAFHTVEVESRVGELLPVMFASLFVNVAAPTAGASGAALFIDDAARRGESAARTAAGTLLMLVADFVSFTVVLSIGLIYLFNQHALQWYEVIGALILLGMTTVLTLVLLLGLWQPDRLHRLLNWVQRTANALAGRLRRLPSLPEDWSETNANEFIEAALAITAHPQRLSRTLLVGFAVHIVDLASLYTLFLAFHTPVTLGMLVSGYAVGVLFWIVSITPQGIGVVEGVMTLIFTSLGVPGANAAIIALSFRGLTFWLPLGIGFFVLRRVRTFRPKERTTKAEAWSVHAVAVLTGVMGIVNVISAVTPALPSRMLQAAEFSPLSVRHGSRLAAALAGFALLMLASNLWRRKRVAWLLTVVILAISAVSHILKGLDFEEATLALALVAWLVYLRPHFHARSDPPSIQQGLRTLAAALLFTLFYGVAGFYLMDHQFKVNFGLFPAVRQTVVMFTQFYDPGLHPVTRLGRFFADSIYMVGAATMGYALIMLVRPVLARPGVPGDVRARAKEIVEKYGCSSLARLALMEDKLYYFSPGGSVVAYVVEGRVALALGDPIGPEDDIGEAIAGFQAFCAPNDWLPAFYQVKPDYLPEYVGAGFNSLRIGQEAIVDLPSFTMSGRTNKGLRSAYNRLVRLGYRARLFEPPLPDDLLQELRRISDAWLTNMRSSEKRFSVGWFEEDYIRNSRIMGVYEPEGGLVAFTNLVPEYQANEVSIDLMRHGDTEHGLMDFLFASLFEWAREHGYGTFSLGLSALSGIGQSPQDPAIERALHYIYEHVNQFYNFKGLHEFKEKFNPAWSPRYLIYPGIANLPAVTIAMIRADSGDDLLGSYFRRD